MKVKFTFFEVEDSSSRLFFNFAGKTTNMAILGKHFYSLETLSFYLEHQQTLFLGLFRPKINTDEISILGLNPWVGKITNMATLGTRLFGKTLDQKQTLFLVFYQKPRKIKF